MTRGLSNLSAEKVVDNLSANQLKIIIKIFGEEKDASKIANNIVKARLRKKITSSGNTSFLKTIRGKGYMLISEYE